MFEMYCLSISIQKLPPLILTSDWLACGTTKNKNKTATAAAPAERQLENVATKLRNLENQRKLPRRSGSEAPTIKDVYVDPRRHGRGKKLISTILSEIVRT